MNHAKEIYCQANERLSQIEEELNRPEEDVMTFSVCHQTRAIIGELFKSFLSYKEVDYANAQDIEALQELCARLNPGFASLELKDMYCYPGNLDGMEGYCMDLERVRICLGKARQLRSLLLQAVPGLE